MSNRLDQFTDALRQRISVMESPLENVKSDIHAHMKNNPKDLQAKFAEAKVAGAVRNYQAIEARIACSESDGAEKH